MRSPRDGVEVPEPLGWRAAAPDVDEIRRLYAPIIRGVIEEKTSQPRIELYLAIGEACPAFTAFTRQIWLEEVRKAGV